MLYLISSNYFSLFILKRQNYKIKSIQIIGSKQGFKSFLNTMKFELSMVDFKQNSEVMMIWENTLFHMNLVEGLSDNDNMNPGFFHFIWLPWFVVFLLKFRNCLLENVTQLCVDLSDLVSAHIYWIIILCYESFTLYTIFLRALSIKMKILKL